MAKDAKETAGVGSEAGADAGPSGGRGGAPGGEGDPGWNPGAAFGAYLRNQRQLARLSLRQLADLTRVSNPYLSQIERGLHQPSVTVIRSLADALGVSAEDLFAHAAGITDEDPAPNGETEAAIRADPRLTTGQKQALLAVYHSMVDGAGGPGGGTASGRAEQADQAGGA